MKIIIDTENRSLELDGDSVPLYSDAAFEHLSDLWVKVGWNQRYSFAFSWMGRPIIQLPEDMIRWQEVVYRVRPTVIIETGVAHGGSLVYSASLLQMFGGGRVVGVDIEVRPHNRAAIEAHEMAPYITLVEGNSVAPEIVAEAASGLTADDRVLVILDSNHTRQHVLDELNAYHQLVTPGSYIVATDGIMSEVADTPRGTPGWTFDNPTQAAIEFAAEHPEFVLEQPDWPFNESTLSRNITHWPGAWLRKK